MKLLVLALFLLVAPANAQDPWVLYLDFRGETVKVISTCGKVKGGGIMRELNTGYQRAVKDLEGTGVAVPHLGTSGWPYTISISGDPQCPGGAIACSGTIGAGSPKWGQIRALCAPGMRNGVRAVDHELFHRACLLVRPYVVPPKSLAELRQVSEACSLADHLAGEGYRYDVAGRRVPKGKP